MEATIGERLDALEAGQKRIELALTLLIGRLPQEQLDQAVSDLFNIDGTLKQLVEVYRNTQRDIRTLESAIRLTLSQLEPPPEGQPRLRPNRRILSAID